MNVIISNAISNVVISNALFIGNSVSYSKKKKIIIIDFIMHINHSLA